MEIRKPQEELYTDIVLELLSAYFYDDGSSHDLANAVMTSVRDNPVLNGKGLMEGLVFSSVVHMALMITLLALITDRPREEALKLYAMSYQSTRETVSMMPQVHPEFVNRLINELEGLL
jgi:hypothetical protein